MTKQTRRKLFYFSIITFIFLSVSVLSFAFGISYDFENKQLIKTGSLSLKADTDADIYIRGEASGTTSLLGSSFSKRNLSPGFYQIEARRKDFQTWSKKAVITAGLVTDFSRVLLVSNIPSEEIVASSISAVFFSDHERWLALVTPKNSLAVFDLYTRTVVYQTSLNGINTKKLKLIWSPDYTKVLAHDNAIALILNVNSKNTLIIKKIPPYFLNEQTTFDGSKIYNIRLQKKQKMLESFDINLAKIDLVVEDLNSFYLFGDKLFFISNADYRPYLIHLDNNRLERFGALPELFPWTISGLEDTNNSLYFLLGDRLYYSDPEKTILIAEKVKKFAISPDQYLLGWITDHFVHIKALRDNFYQPQRVRGEEDILFETADKLQNLNWHLDGAHIFLTGAQQPMLLIETDRRGGLNQNSLLGPSGYSQWNYAEVLNKIVALKDNQLVLISF